MSFQPIGSFNTIGTLSDILKDFPLASHETLNKNTSSLINNPQHREIINKLLNVNDPNLAKQLSEALNNVDNSRIKIKNEKPFTDTNIPPILQEALKQNNNLLNGAYKTLNAQINQSPHSFHNAQKTLETHYTSPSLANTSNNNEYSIVQNVDSNKLCLKLTKKPNQTPESLLNKNENNLKPSKFYSTTTTATTTIESPNTSKQSILQPKIINKPPIAKKPKLQINQQLNEQLNLPSDFTPELIEQLKAEGCNLATRKVRQQQQKQTSRISSDDEEDDNNTIEIKLNKKLKHITNKRIDDNNEDDDSLMYNNDLSLKRAERLSVQSSDMCDPNNDNPLLKRFLTKLEDLFETYEENFEQKIKFNLNNNENENETSDFLIARKLSAELAQDAFRLKSYSLMSHIKIEYLIKLQTILYFNIKDGHKTFDDFVSLDDKLRDLIYEKIMRAGDSSLISLLIMTSPKISKNLIMEDLIEQICLFTKIHLTNTIFSYYDSVYKNSKVDNKKLNTKSNLNNTKYIQHFYNRLREILNLLSNLITNIDMTDTIIITLSSMCIMCFFVDNINDIQLESIKILTCIFNKYETHRQLIYDDLLNSLVKLNSNNTKRNLRTFKCINGDSIQMFTALVLQLAQSQIITHKTLINNSQEPITSTSITNKMDDNTLMFDEKELYLINSFENSNQTIKKFLQIFFSKCKTKQNDFDYRPIFENFIQDLLITVNKPEWPASELFLNIIGVILIHHINNDSTTSDVASRVNSLEYLGQIVAQLRRDSLEAQKSPNKLFNLIIKLNESLDECDRIKIDSNESIDFILNNLNFIYQLKKILILYLESLQANDLSLVYAKNFLVAEWLNELTKTKHEESLTNDDRIKKYSSLEELRKNIYNLLEPNISKKLANKNVLDNEYNNACLLLKFINSTKKKTLDKNFDCYLMNILNLLANSNEATQVRSKAIKCLSSIIEADPSILLTKNVFTYVQANFKNPTISVREAAVDLIGRFIQLRPELTNQYYDLLSERILDVGVSVRKRVLKIFRDLCLNNQQLKFERLTETCVKILRRINDEDGIKKIVLDTFYNLWFTHIKSDDLILKRVLNIVDVISEFNTIPNGNDLFESLFNSLVNHNQHQQQQQQQDTQKLNETDKDRENAEQQALKRNEVLKSCKQIVDCLISHVLRTEANTNNPQAHKRLVASFSTLYVLSKIKPENFRTHVEIIQPYLNIKCTNSNDLQIINNAAKILECVVPLLNCPSNSFLVALEESLCKLIFSGGIMIVSSCVECFGTVVNKLTKNYKLASDCLIKFYKNAKNLNNSLNKQLINNNNKLTIDQQTKAIIYRVLYTLGLLSKQFQLDSDHLKEFNLFTKEDLFNLFLDFMNYDDNIIKLRSLTGLGSFLTRYYDFMITNEIKTIYLKYLTELNDTQYLQLKSQIFKNLTDYLNEEDKRNYVESSNLAKTHAKDENLKEMLDVQSGMSSTIVQLYLQAILDSYLINDLNLRTSISLCLNQILTQGLVYPLDCISTLIAMSTDQDKSIQIKAINHLNNLYRAYPNFIQSKSICGILLSFKLQKIIQTSQQQSEQSKNDVELIVRGVSDTNNELLSLNHNLYSLIRTTKSPRRAFIQQILKLFSNSSSSSSSIINLKELLYISDNLAYFPYQLLDEPFYLIYQIDFIINEIGIDILHTFKENLLNCKNNSLNESSINDDDDDDEIDDTYEKILTRLPTNLKPLVDCMNIAHGCYLLIILKQFLKEVYLLNDTKLQAYNPNDSNKLYDKPIMNRKNNLRFNPKQTINYIKQNGYGNDINKNQLIKDYLEFKELMFLIDNEEDQEQRKRDQNNHQFSTPMKPQAQGQICALRQRLMDCIEKVSNTSSSFINSHNKSDNNNNSSILTTPNKSAHNNTNRSLNKRNNDNSSKKSSIKKTTKKRKRKAIYSSDEEDDINQDNFNTNDSLNMSSLIDD